jgi:hypothetical protein
MRDAIETKNPKSPMNPNHSKQSIPKENWLTERDCGYFVTSLQFALR